MIHLKMWDSEQFLSLTAWERVLYIALIVHADDEGCFPASPDFWKRNVFYGQKIGIGKIKQMIDRLTHVGLIVTGNSKKGFAGFHPNWHDYQTLTAARSKPSAYSDLLVDNGHTPRFQSSTQGKLSEVEVRSGELNPSNDERSESRPSFKGLFDEQVPYKPESILNAIPENRRGNFQRPSPKDFNA